MGTTIRLGYISRENNHWHADPRLDAFDVSLEKAAICVMDAEGTPIVERAAPSGAVALGESLSTLPERPERIGVEAASLSGMASARPG